VVSSHDAAAIAFDERAVPRAVEARTPLLRGPMAVLQQFPGVAAAAGPDRQGSRSPGPPSTQLSPGQDAGQFSIMVITSRLSRLLESGPFLTR